jgi:hypothetical protein
MKQVQTKQWWMLLAVMAALLMVAAPGMAAGTLGDPTLGPNYFQTTMYFTPSATVTDPTWSRDLNLTVLGDDAADRAYTAGTPLANAYLTLEHSGNSGPSLQEVWLVGSSGQLLVGVLGSSAAAPRREHWALDANARAAILSSPATFRVRLTETTLGEDTLQLNMARVSGDLEREPGCTPEPGSIVLLLSGAGLLVPLVTRRRRV